MEAPDGAGGRGGTGTLGRDPTPVGAADGFGGNGLVFGGSSFFSNSGAIGFVNRDGSAGFRSAARDTLIMSS